VQPTIGNFDSNNQPKCERPPLGILPKYIWLDHRKTDLENAINRRFEAGLKVPVEWIEEYNELANGATGGVVGKSDIVVNLQCDPDTFNNEILKIVNENMINELKNALKSDSSWRDEIRNITKRDHL